MSEKSESAESKSQVETPLICDLPLGARDIIENVIRRGSPEKRGLRPYVEALAYSRWQAWRKLELEQYVKLGVLLDRHDGPLDPDVAERLRQEITQTDITEDVEVVLRVLLGALEHAPANGLPSAGIEGYVHLFEDKMEQQPTAWKARVLADEFFECLLRLDPEFAEERRRLLTRRLPDWTLDYQSSAVGHDFNLQSRGIFTVITAAAWSNDISENVAAGLDGALNCAVDKLMQACRFDWFRPFIETLSTQLGRMHLCHRLSGETLYAISERLGETRRDIHERDAATALAITTLEEAIHRPHRLQLDRTPIDLELELPGVRGFGKGVRLHVFDISRDGCLAVMKGPARFEETAPPEEFQLERGPGRTYGVRRLAGVIHREDGDFTVRPDTELVLHDTTKGDRDWAAIDSAGIVRFTPEAETGRLWLGFHFDRMAPEVQQELENRVHHAA